MISPDDINISPYPSDKLLTVKFNILASNTKSLGLKLEMNDGSVMIKDIDEMSTICTAACYG